MSYAVISVKFVNTPYKSYNYLVPSAIYSPLPGDWAVVNTLWPSKNAAGAWIKADAKQRHTHFSVVRIETVWYPGTVGYTEAEKQATKEVVRVLSNQQMDNHVAKLEAKLTKEVEKKDALRRLEAMLAEQTPDLTRYRALAQSNPEAAKLLALVEGTF